RSLREFAWRCGGARMGALLFKDVHDNGFVGPGAVFANVMSVVPRTIWPSQGYGNSRDGSVSGTPPYRVSIVATGLDTNNQSDSVSSAAIAYWLLGWFGVILSAAFGAWFTCFILSR